MREDFSYLCKDVSDHEHKELKVDEIHNIFKENYFVNQPSITVADMNFTRKEDIVKAEIIFAENGTETTIISTGNGSLDAVSNALKTYTGKTYILQEYTEHSLQAENSMSSACAYIGIKDADGTLYWGAGMNTDIIHASVDALLCAFNKMNKEN